MLGRLGQTPRSECMGMDKEPTLRAEKDLVYEKAGEV